MKSNSAGLSSGRRLLIVGNWKMNGTRSALAELAVVDREATAAANVEVAVALPYTLLAAGAEATSAVRVGSQDIHFATAGAHTGCISAEMAFDAGATFTIIGHSEVRSRGDFGGSVQRKLQAASSAGLIPLLCIGEDKDARETGRTLSAIASELARSFVSGLPDLWVAYEPLWAIGTGRAARSEDIAEVHSMLREQLGPSIPLLYGGSVTAANIYETLITPNVDGVLVGGASLQAATFIPIIRAAVESCSSLAE